MCFLSFNWTILDNSLSPSTFPEKRQSRNVHFHHLWTPCDTAWQNNFLSTLICSMICIWYTFFHWRCVFYIFTYTCHLFLSWTAKCLRVNKGLAWYVTRGVLTAFRQKWVIIGETDDQAVKGKRMIIFRILS